MSCFLIRDNSIIDLSGCEIQRRGREIYIQSARGCKVILLDTKEEADLLWADIKTTTWRYNNTK